MRDADRITIDNQRRRITHRWFLDREPIDRGRPCLVFECRHDRQRKTFEAVLSYCEHEQHAGYAFDRWESGWLLARIDSEPVARFTPGRLQHFAAQALTLLADPIGPAVVRDHLAMLEDTPATVAS